MKKFLKGISVLVVVLGVSLGSYYLLIGQTSTMAPDTAAVGSPVADDLASSMTPDVNATEDVDIEEDVVPDDYVAQPGEEIIEEDVEEDAPMDDSTDSQQDSDGDADGDSSDSDDGMGSVDATVTA